MVSSWRDQYLFLYLSPILASWWSFLFCKFFLTCFLAFRSPQNFCRGFDLFGFIFRFSFSIQKQKLFFISMACFSSFFWLQASLTIFLFLLKIIPKKCYMYAGTHFKKSFFISDNKSETNLWPAFIFFHFFVCVVWSLLWFFSWLLWVILNQVCFYDLFFSIFMDVLKCFRFFLRLDLKLKSWEVIF